MRGIRAATAAIGACAACLLALPATALAWTPEPASFAVGSPQEQTITMSDGVSLKADVYYPTDPKTGQPAKGPFPVILSMTPYGKRSAVTKNGGGSAEEGGNGYYPYLVERGYINAIADVRGTGSSDGDFQLFGPRERQDGVELVRWAAKISGSTGTVGEAGESYVGLNQLYTAALIGPHSPLKAIVPVTAGNDLYRDISFMGGIPNLEFALFFLGLRASMTGAVPDNPTGDPLALVQHPVDRAQRLGNFDAGLYSEIDTGGPRAYDSQFWEDRAPRNYLPQIVKNGVPAFLWSGWFDVYQRGVSLNYAELQNAWALSHGARPSERPQSVTAPMNPRQRTTGRYQLAVGPWYHDPVGIGMRFQELQLEWFDTWLKGAQTGVERTSTPMHVFELGPNRWLNASSYPLPQAQAQSFYLGANGTLAPQRPHDATGADQLPWTNQTSPCNRGVDQWNTGLGTYAAALAGFPGLPACTNDDSTTQAASVTYTTAPFARDETVAGPMTASVKLSSTTADAELVATVEDVAPDGSSYPLSTGALIGSHRALDTRRSWYSGGRLLLPIHPHQAASALVPGKVERLDVEIYPTFTRIARGHRLRLTLSSGLTSLEPTPVQDQGLAGGVYSIERNGTNASQLNVPLAAPAALTPSGISYGACNGGCKP